MLMVWRTGSSMMSCKIIFYPMEDILKLHVDILIRSVSGMGGGLLGGYGGFLTRDLKGWAIFMVIHDPV